MNELLKVLICDHLCHRRLKSLSSTRQLCNDSAWIEPTLGANLGGGLKVHS